jgi:type II secretory pathway component PulF
MTSNWLPGRISMKDRSLMARSLAAFIASGESHEKAFSSLAKGTNRSLLRSTLLHTSEELRKDELISVIKKKEFLFGSLFRTVIESGESSGTTVISLFHLAEFYDRQIQLEKTVFRKLFSTLVMTCGAIGALFTIAGILISTIGDKWLDFTAQLPVLRNVAVFSSTSILNYNGMGILLIVMLFTLLFFLTLFTVRIPIIEAGIWKLPLIGNWRRSATIQRFFLSLSLLLTGGMDLERAIQCSAAESRSGHLSRITEYLLAIKPVSLNSMAKTLESYSIIPYLIEKKVTESTSPQSSGELFKKIGHFYQGVIVESTSAVAIVAGPLIIAVTGILIFSILIGL